MRRRRGAKAPELSLFPFLAVLLCTMGILVLFLFVSVRIAGDNARIDARKAREEITSQLNLIESATQLEEIRYAGWVEQREKFLEQYREHRIRQNELIRQIEDLKEQTSALQQERRLIAEASESDKAAAKDRLAALENERSLLQRELAEAEQDLKEVDGKNATADSVVYSIVPFEGSGGTNRRPIYVECREDAVVIQPLGIRLLYDDFVEPGMPGNPLDAVLGEIRDYWIRHDVAGAEGQPYPLLVIRPGGAGAYSLARRSMQGWTDEFGYELIPEDLELDFGPVDPELAAVANQTLKDSRQRLLTYHQQMEIRRDRENSARDMSQMVTVSGLRASRAGGGFVSGNGDQPSTQLDEMSPPPSSKGGFSGVNSVGNASNQQFESIRTAGNSGGPEGSGESETEGNGNPKNVASTEATSGTPHETSSRGDESGGIARSGNTGNIPCAADNKGAGWAIDRRENQITGYRRPIVVWCDEKQLVVDSGHSQWIPDQTVSLEEMNVETAEKIADSVRKVIGTWGTPPRSGFWKPELRIRVLNGGADRFEALKVLLGNSGIDLLEVNE